MKQSIRLTRATLYFKFIAFRDLTSVRAGATPQRMFEKRKRHGETDVKVLPWSQWFFLIFWAFIVHCNAPINSNEVRASPDKGPTRYARAPTNRLGPPHTSRQGPTRRFEI